MSTPDLRTIERNMMAEDASFIVGLSLAAKVLPGRSSIPYLFSSVNFYSLIVHETYVYFTKNDPVQAAALKHAFADDIKQSRQRIKIYDDKALGIDGIGKTMLDGITAEHQKELTKTHKIKLPKWAWKDVGLYFVEGNPIAVGSTHLASFNLGMNVARIFQPSTAKAFGEELGKFLIAMAKAITLVRLPQLTIIADDVRSEKIYTQEKYGSPSKNVNAGLSIIDMNMNFAALCLPPSRRHPTLLKWKFLTTYHAVSSLKMLRNSEHAKTMDPAVMSRIDQVLDTDFAKMLETEGAVILRNNLTHYKLDNRIDASLLHDNPRKYHGVIEASLPNWTLESLAERLDEFIEGEMLNLFRAWGE